MKRKVNFDTWGFVDHGMGGQVDGVKMPSHIMVETGDNDIDAFCRSIGRLNGWYCGSKLEYTDDDGKSVYQVTCLSRGRYGNSIESEFHVKID